MVSIGWGSIEKKHNTGRANDLCRKYLPFFGINTPYIMQKCFIESFIKQLLDSAIKC